MGVAGGVVAAARESHQLGRAAGEASRRRILDAVFYLVRAGVAWRYLPKGFPPRNTVYGFFARWRADGTWLRIHDALRDRVRVAAGRAPNPTAAIIDSQSVRAAATVGNDSRGFDGGKKVNVNDTSQWMPAGCCWSCW